MGILIPMGLKAPTSTLTSADRNVLKIINRIINDQVIYLQSLDQAKLYQSKILCPNQ